MNEGDRGMMDELDIQRKRVLYRSHHTGMKENDILVGAFADANLATMSDDDVAWFERLLLDQDDIDIHNWMTGRQPIPAELDHPVIHRLLEFRLAG